MPEAMIVGAFGQGNPGDDALADVHVKVVRDAGWDPCVVTATPRQTGAELGCAAVAPEPLAVLHASRRAGALVVGGGTIFKTLHPSTGRPKRSLLVRVAALTAVARAANTTVALSGVGAAPLRRSSERALARSIVRCADLLILRDEESAAILRDAGSPPPFRVGADPAWTHLEQGTRATATTDVLVVLSRFAARRGLSGWLSAALRKLATEDVSVMPWQRGPTGDSALAAALVARLSRRTISVPAPASLDEARSVAQTANVAICLAFHGAMACAFAGIPFVAVGHEPKLIALARRLDQPCVAPGCPPFELATAVSVARASGPAATDLIERERRRAEDGLRLLRLTLSEGATYHDAVVPALELVDSDP